MLNVLGKKRPFGWGPAHFFLRVALCCLFLGAKPALGAGAAGSNALPQTVDELEVADQKYQEFIDQFFRQYLKHRPPASVSDIQAIVKMTDNAPVAEVLAVVRANLDLLLQNVTKKEFDVLLTYLYRHNDTATVQSLNERLKKVGDPVATSQNYFLLAKYYEARQNWRGVQGALSKVNLRDLSLGDSHYSNLLMGFALQNLKQHRKALTYYQQIPETSPYSSHVKLNEGTAFLRQGWWTEAHLEFAKAIESLDKTGGDSELRNRILVVLGYSQLNYQFYRDARDTFRKVALNSGSMNKALMGIGLAAAYQKDFLGAANAFSLLTEKSPADLSVDEAYLLLPAAYGEAGDAVAAATAYQNAIRHYEAKIEELGELKRRLRASDLDASLQTIKELDARAREIYGAEAPTPSFLLANYQNLLALRQLSATVGQASQFEELHQDYKKLIQGLSRNKLDARIEILNSYLSQAKFGMAQLYDKP